jgi:hypothetical protein
MLVLCLDEVQGRKTSTLIIAVVSQWCKKTAISWDANGELYYTKQVCANPAEQPLVVNA